MNQPIDTSTPSLGDIATEREEISYLLPIPSIGALINELDEMCTTQQCGTTTPLIGADYFVTTIYFDTTSGLHYRAAIADNEHSLKVRARSYSNVAGVGVNKTLHDAALWLELKRREGTRTLKQRALLTRREILALVCGQQATDNLCALAPRTTHRQRVKNQIAAYCESLPEPLRASSVVSYRRFAFQTANEQLRITLDVQLAYFSPPASLWDRERPLVASQLGTPRAISDHAVLEIKSRTALPEWCTTLLARHALSPTRFCKFLAAERAVRGALERA